MTCSEKKLVAELTRRPGRPDTFIVWRSTGARTQWQVPTYRANVPHDLVHWAVESVFELKNGLWGLVDAGVDPARANLAASGVDASARATFGTDLKELLMAEGLCAVSWHDPTVDETIQCDHVVKACSEFGAPAPPSLSPARVALARHALHDLRAWFRIESTLTIAFYPDNPQRGLYDALERIGRA